MSQLCPLVVLAITLGSCAASPGSPVEQEASQASSLPPLPTEAHETANFRIEYRPADHELAPLPDCTVPDPDPTNCYSAGGGTRENVPDMIEDMGTFLEYAYLKYTQDGYRFRSNGKMLVDVRPTNRPNSVAYVQPDETILFEPRLGGSGDPIWLKHLATHELFHVIQYRAYLQGLEPTDAMLEGFTRHKWLLEATATDQELKHVPPPPPPRNYGEFEGVMARYPIHPSGNTNAARFGYESATFLQYVKRETGVDVTKVLFNPTNPTFRYNTVPTTGSTLTVLNERLAAIRPQRASRLELWKRYSYALHYAHSERYIPGIRALTGPPPERDESLVAPLSGYEREQPRAGFDLPRRQYTLVANDAGPQLALGYAFSYRIDLRQVLCDTPDELIPGTTMRCNGTKAIRDRTTAKLVLRVATPPAGTLTVYKVPAGSDLAQVIPTVLVADRSGAATHDIELPLTQLRFGDDVVVSVVFDPESPAAGATLTLDTFFRTACDQRTEVRCDFVEGCNLRDVTIPLECRNIEMWAWGGGANQAWDSHQRSYGAGGGGAFVHLRIDNDHPRYHALRMWPATGASAASTVNWMGAGYWAPLMLAAAGGGSGSWGYTRVTGTDEYTFVYARGGAGDQAGEGTEFALGGTVGEPGRGGIALITEVSTAANGRDGSPPSAPFDGGFLAEGTGGIGLVNGLLTWTGRGGDGYYGGGAGGFGRRLAVDSQGGSGGGGGKSFGDGLGATLRIREIQPGEWATPGASAHPLRCVTLGCRTGYGGVEHLPAGGGAIVLAYE